MVRIKGTQKQRCGSGEFYMERFAMHILL